MRMVTSFSDSEELDAAFQRHNSMLYGWNGTLIQMPLLRKLVLVHPERRGRGRCLNVFVDPWLNGTHRA